MGIGFPELLIAGLVGGLLLVARRSSSAGADAPTLVLREFSLTPARTEVLVIRGRVAGLLGWLLTTLQLSDETTFSVTREAISCRSGSMRGQTHVFLPLVDVAMTSCRFSAPLWMLFVAAGVGVLGLLSALAGHADASVLLGCLLVAAVFIGLYHLNKRLEIRVDSHGCGGLGVAFKPSAIEQVYVDLNRALDAVAAINAAVLTAQSGSATNRHDARADVDPPTESAAARPAPPRGTCPSCGAVAEPPNSAFCSNCGTQLGAARH